MLKTTGGWRGFGVGARRVNDKCKHVYVWGWGDEGDARMGVGREDETVRRERKKREGRRRAENEAFSQTTEQD